MLPDSSGAPSLLSEGTNLLFSFEGQSSPVNGHPKVCL